jgi:hypothetical protein
VTNSKKGLRGAALPETAVVLSFVLVMVLGGIQMGVVGALQLTTDGAASVAAHEYALNYAKTSAENQTTVTNVFPQINGPTTIASNAPNVVPSDVSVAYPTSQTARQGGASLIRASNLQATVQTTGPAGALGQFLAGMAKFGVHGSAIEPLNWQSNSQYDVADAGYTSTTPTESAFFGSVQDVPFSYVSSSRMTVCLQGGSTSVQPSFGLTCPAADQQVLTLGSAEFLDQDNWSRSTGYGACPFGGSPGNANLYANTCTFAEMLCHQQLYAQLESYLVNAVRPSDITQPAHTLATPPPFVIGNQNTWNIVNQKSGTTALPTLIDIYSWDTTVVAATDSGNNATTITPYTSASQYGSNVLHPGKNCT